MTCTPGKNRSENLPFCECKVGYYAVEGSSDCKKC